MSTFTCLTRWSDAEGNSFNRTHDREARDLADARSQEEFHNSSRSAVMADDGWTWEVVRVTAAAGPAPHVDLAAARELFRARCLARRRVIDAVQGGDGCDWDDLAFGFLLALGFTPSTVTYAVACDWAATTFL